MFYSTVTDIDFLLYYFVIRVWSMENAPWKSHDGFWIWLAERHYKSTDSTDKVWSHLHLYVEISWVKHSSQ